MTKMQMLVVILWLVPLLWRFRRALVRIGEYPRLIMRDWAAFLFAAAAFCAALYAYPIRAAKTTNPPAYGPRRAVYIRMIRDPLTGRLHPVGAPLKLPEAVHE